MSDIPKPNTLYLELRDQLVDDEVETIKHYLRNNPLTPRDLQNCSTFADICYSLESKKKIKPDEDDYTILEKMFEVLKLMTLKDMVTKFAANCRQSRKLQASGHTVTEEGPASKDKDYADPDRYRNDGRGHYRSSGRSEQVEATHGQGGSSSTPQSTGGAQPQGSSDLRGRSDGRGNFGNVVAGTVTINQTIYQQAAGTQSDVEYADDADTNPQE